MWAYPVEPEAADLGLLGGRERLRKAEQITIWAASGLSEQLFIAHVIHRAEEWGVDATKIRLVQFETLRNRAAHVLGERSVRPLSGGVLKGRRTDDHARASILRVQRV